MKAVLTILAILASAALILLAGLLLAREIPHEFRIRRTRKLRQVSGNTVARDYSHRDEPAWQRVESETRPGRRHRVSLALRELGE